MPKTRADYCQKIEVWWLLRNIKKQGGYKHATVSWGDNESHGIISVQASVWSEKKYVRFIYTQTDHFSSEKKKFDYKIPIIETSCNFGGARYWFECTLSKNNQYCGRRVGVLYKDGDWFACRHCYDLTYSSRKNSRRYRMNPLFRVIELDMKIEKLQQKTKRYTYKGTPTKKRQKLHKLYAETAHHYKHIRI